MRSRLPKAPRPILYPYDIASGSSASLARSLGTYRIFPDRHYRYRKHHRIVNWGNSINPAWSIPDRSRMLNLPHAVNLACSKTATFKRWKDCGVPSPFFTFSIEEAKDMITKNRPMLCRTIDRGSGGAGIVIARKPEEVVPAPVYVSYVPKMAEYRIHVFLPTNRFVIDQKRFRGNQIPKGTLIRNVENGFFYSRHSDLDQNEQNKLFELAKKAVEALGLDFGAVDVIRAEDNGAFLPLEVNTAPGLEGSRIDWYKQQIQQWVNS